MAPDFPVVVRLPRVDHADEEATFVLLHVSPDGHRPLDLKLIGTENETVFAVSCKVGHSIPRLGPTLGPHFHALSRELTNLELISRTRQDLIRPESTSQSRKMGGHISISLTRHCAR